MYVLNIRSPATHFSSFSGERALKFSNRKAGFALGKRIIGEAFWRRLKLIMWEHLKLFKRNFLDTWKRKAFLILNLRHLFTSFQKAQICGSKLFAAWMWWWAFALYIVGGLVRWGMLILLFGNSSGNWKTKLMTMRAENVFQGVVFSVRQLIWGFGWLECWEARLEAGGSGN